MWSSLNGSKGDGYLRLFLPQGAHGIINAGSDLGTGVDSIDKGKGSNVDGRNKSASIEEDLLAPERNNSETREDIMRELFGMRYSGVVMIASSYRLSHIQFDEISPEFEDGSQVKRFMARLIREEYARFIRKVEFYFSTISCCPWQIKEVDKWISNEELFDMMSNDEDFPADSDQKIEGKSTSVSFDGGGEWRRVSIPVTYPENTFTVKRYYDPDKNEVITEVRDMRGEIIPLVLYSIRHSGPFPEPSVGFHSECCAILPELRRYEAIRLLSLRVAATRADPETMLRRIIPSSNQSAQTEGDMRKNLLQMLLDENGRVYELPNDDVVRRNNCIWLPAQLDTTSFQPRAEFILDLDRAYSNLTSLVSATFGVPIHILRDAAKVVTGGRKTYSGTDRTSHVIDEERAQVNAMYSELVNDLRLAGSAVWKVIFKQDHAPIFDIPIRAHVDFGTLAQMIELGAIDNRQALPYIKQITGIDVENLIASRVLKGSRTSSKQRGIGSPKSRNARASRNESSDDNTNSPNKSSSKEAMKWTNDLNDTPLTTERRSKPKSRRRGRSRRHHRRRRRSRSSSTSNDDNDDDGDSTSDSSPSSEQSKSSSNLSRQSSKTKSKRSRSRKSRHRRSRKGKRQHGTTTAHEK